MSQPHEQTAGRIRLGCLFCDRIDFDRVDCLPSDWERIESVQSFENSVISKGFSDKLHESCFDWQTHLGICPDCSNGIE